MIKVLFHTSMCHVKGVWPATAPQSPGLKASQNEFLHLLHDHSDTFLLWRWSHLPQSPEAYLLPRRHKANLLTISWLWVTFLFHQTSTSIQSFFSPSSFRVARQISRTSLRPTKIFMLNLLKFLPGPISASAKRKAVALITTHLDRSAFSRVPKPN